jgi:hypothetical protein
MGKTAQDYHAELKHLSELYDATLAKILRGVHRLEKLYQQRKRITKVTVKLDEEAAAAKAKAKAKRSARPQQAEAEPPIEVICVGDSPLAKGKPSPELTAAEKQAAHAAKMAAAGFRKTSSKRSGAPR